jgi:hypothetical protein
MPPSDRRSINSALFNVIKRVIDQEAPLFRDSSNLQQDSNAGDMKSLIKMFISEERLRNPPVERSTGGSGIDEQYLRDLIRQILSEEYRPDPNDPDLREAIKQVLAEEATYIEEKHAELAFKEKQTVVRPEESLTTNDRNEIDFYIRNPGIGSFVLTVIMLSYGVYPKPKNVFSMAESYEFDLDAKVDTGSLGNDNAADDSEGDTIFSGVQTSVFKVLAVISPTILTVGQFVYIFYIFRRVASEIGGFYNEELCPGQKQKSTTPTDLRVIMGFISAFFVVKNVQTLSAYLSALKGRSEGSALVYADEEEGISHAEKVKNVRDSWIFPFYALDCILNLLITYFVLICNLYIVFVATNTPLEMLSNTVILNFIFEQLPKFKHSLFDGKTGKGLLSGLRAAHRTRPIDRSWRLVCDGCATVVPTAAQLLSVVPLLFPMAMTVYGPICKPGIQVGPLPSVFAAP